MDAMRWVSAIASTHPTRGIATATTALVEKVSIKMIAQAQGLAQAVPIDMQRHLGALSVRVQAPSGATEAEISDAVAEAIMRALRK